MNPWVSLLHARQVAAFKLPGSHPLNHTRFEILVRSQQAATAILHQEPFLCPGQRVRH